MFITDYGNNCIRKRDIYGIVTTFAGNGIKGYSDGTGTNAAFYSPVGMCIDGSDNLYIADSGNHVIRKITSSGVVTTIAGLGGTSGFTNGNGTSALFNIPWGIAMDGSGNLFVCDSNNNVVRKIDTSGNVTTFVGSGTSAMTDGTGTGASFSNLRFCTFDGSGNLYVTSGFANIRQITPSGVVTTIAGSTTGIRGNTLGTGTAARFDNPLGMKFDASGNMIIMDANSNQIKKMTTGYVVTGTGG
jgi:streptogramin lyase